MEIILVNPGGTPAGGDTLRASKAHRYMYPYGIMYVYNYLAMQNIRSKVFDPFQGFIPNLSTWDFAVRLEHFKSVYEVSPKLFSFCINRGLVKFHLALIQPFVGILSCRLF